jgi:hypothetical protein
MKSDLLKDYRMLHAQNRLEGVPTSPLFALYQDSQGQDHLALIDNMLVRQVTDEANDSPVVG